jgi:uncharacterized membrane protein
MVVAVVIRIALIPCQGLWADEIFSLAMATGHSIEQGVNESRPELGDYYENRQPRPASFFRTYLQNDRGTSVSRITRAVLLSDTSPPLYYLLLHAWILRLGTSDFSLRMFSVLWSVASIPLVFFIGRRIGNSQAGIIACSLFAIAPQALFYSTEGRMYSLVWFLICAYASTILLLHDEGIRWDRVTAAILSGAAGLLTHYFFFLPWVACTFWLLIEPGRTPRWIAIVLTVGVSLLTIPWCVHLLLSASLAGRRVTGYWLYRPNPIWPQRTAIFHLLWSFFSIEGIWNGSKRFDHLQMVFIVVIVAAAWVRHPGVIMNRRIALLWIWMAAALITPIAFDIGRGTFSSEVERYVLAGLPAAFILLAFCFAQIPAPLRIAAGGMIVLACMIGDRRIFLNQSRQLEPFRETARQISRDACAPDLLIVHSVPSGILGIARYFDSNVPIFSWVGQLHVRTVPEDIARVSAGTQKVMLVKIHQVLEPSPEDGWLRAGARDTRTRNDEGAEIVTFDLVKK